MLMFGKKQGKEENGSNEPTRKETTKYKNILRIYYVV